jgi:hypothetical protein
LKTLRLIGIIFCVLLIMTSVIACGGQTDPDPDPDPDPQGGDENDDENDPQPGNQNEEPKDLTVTFDIPEGWTLTEPTPTNMDVEVKNLSNGANLNVTSGRRVGASLEEHVEKAKAALVETFDNAQWDDDRSLQVDGHDAIELNFTYPVANLEMLLKQTYVDIEGEIYLFTFSCFAKDAETMVQDYQTIIETARFE